MILLRIILLFTLCMMQNAFAVRKKAKTVSKKSPTSLEVRQLDYFLKTDTNGKLNPSDLVRIGQHCGVPVGKDAQVHELAGGANNAGVFAVVPQQSPVSKDQQSLSYVVKMSSDGGTLEFDNIRNIFAHGLGLSDSVPLAKPLGFIKCCTSNGEKMASVTAYASGTCFEQILKSKISLSEKFKAFQALGKTLAALHQENLSGYTSIVLGDCNPENAFYDFQTEEIIFIDYEKSAYSTPPNPKQSILWDIMSMIIVPLLYDGKICEDKVAVQNLISCFNTFLTAYITAYPDSDQQAFNYHIKTFIDAWFDMILGRMDLKLKKKGYRQDVFLTHLKNMVGSMHAAFEDQVKGIIGALIKGVAFCKENGTEKDLRDNVMLCKAHLFGAGNVRPRKRIRE